MASDLAHREATAASAIAMSAEFGYRLPHANYRIGDWMDSTNGNPYAVMIGDVTRDGRNDLILVTSTSYGLPPLAIDHKVIVFPQRDDGTLGAFSLHPYSNGLYANVNNYPYASPALVDMNRDGFLDIVVGYGLGVSVLMSTQGGGFETRSYRAGLGLPSWVEHIAVVDLDRDGDFEVVAFDSQAGATLFPGIQGGWLEQGVAVLPEVQGLTDAKVADWNMDGAADLAVLSGSRPSGTIYLIPNMGTLALGVASQLPLEPLQNYGGIAIGDWSGDMRADIAISRTLNIPQAGPGPAVLIFEQVADRQFASPVNLDSWQLPESLLVADVDGDLRDDLVIDHPGWDIGYMRRTSNGLETERLANHGRLGGEGHSTQDLAVGDLDGDGCAELARAEFNVGAMVYTGQNCARYIFRTGGPLRPERVQ